MFHSAGSRASVSFAASGLGSGRCRIGASAGVSGKQVSSYSIERTVALRSWKGQQNYHSLPTATARIPTTRRSLPSCVSNRLNPTRAAAITVVGGTQQRTFFSDPHSPTQKELLQGSSSSRFSPLEDFLMDAIAWTVALSLWYIPRMDFYEDKQPGDCDGDAQDERHLEYREDYGPSISQWPSSSSPTPSQSPSTTPETSTKRRNPKNHPKEEK